MAIAGGRRPAAERVAARKTAARRKRIQDQALIEVKGCLADLDLGRPAARKSKAVTEKIIAPEYEGRVLIELLQNAHDAHHESAADGLVEILLDEDEGEHGTLYVANGGRPFARKDFKALCSLALSSKRADAGIGHKGVGFKSVTQLCDVPEIYSVAKERSRVFDGYTFRFARLDDFDVLAREVAPERPELADYLKENQHPLEVPIFQECESTTAQLLLRRGCVTVVRLPLRSADARAAAEEQVRELMDETAPFELFLDRLARVRIERRAAGKKRFKIYGRTADVLYKRDGLTVRHVALSRGMRLIVVSGKVDTDRAREALAPSIKQNAVWSDWTALEKKAEVRVVVPVDEPLQDGRFYTFLPMGETVRPPLRGYVHAPFMADLNRRAFNDSVPWNVLLLDTAAELCVRAVLAAAEGRVEIPAGALVDLMCWRSGTLERLTSAFRERGHDTKGVSFIPAIATVSGDSSTSLGRGSLWEGKSDATVFTPYAAAAAGVTDLIDPGLHPTRRRRLAELAKGTYTSLEPAKDQLSTWAERVAEALAREPFDPGQWVDFYYDLSQTFPDGKALSGKRVVMNSALTLVPAGDPGVFLDRGASKGGSLPPLPEGLSDRLCFVHEGIHRSGKRGRRKAQGRSWLGSGGLAHEFMAERVLDVVAAVLRESEDDGVRLACLRYACVLSGGLGGGKPRSLAGLQVPTRAGWTRANWAMFGPGWPGENATVDDVLTRFLGGVRELSTVLRITEGRLLLRPEEMCGDSGISVEAMRSFLEGQGVKHGLQPRYEPFDVGIEGRLLNHPRRFWASSRRSLLEAWRTTATSWENRQSVYYPTVDYHARSRTAAVLPGQDDYDSFSDEDRRLFAELVVQGLATWPEVALEMEFVRYTDSAGTPWPTPLAAFLSQAAWIPQTPAAHAPSEEGTFAASGTAWWWRGTQAPPAFVPVVPATLRRRQSSLLSKRLGLLNIRSWDDPGSALARLRHLPELVEAQVSLRVGRLAHDIGREYETAWAHLLAPEAGKQSYKGQQHPAPKELLVTREGALEVLPAGEGGESVYVPDPLGAQNRALLDRVPVPVLAVRDGALGSRVHAFLDRAKTSYNVQTCAKAERAVHADGLPLDEAPRTPLSEYAGPWLHTLLAAHVEFDDERTSRTRPVTAVDVGGALRVCDVTVAGEAVVWIAGHRLAEDGEDCAFLHPDPERPRIVVALRGPRTNWRVMRTAAPAVADLVSAPYLRDRLFAALVKLEGRGLKTDHVPDADLAAVLDLAPHQLRAVLAERPSQRSGSTRVVPLLACLHLDLADELRGRAEEFPDRAALAAWLTGKVGAQDAALLIQLLEDDDQERQLAALSVSLSDANEAWRTLDLRQVDNKDRHERRFAAWLQRHRPALAERVRDAHAEAHRAGSSLVPYVKLRDLPDLLPDPTWHSTLWDLSDELLRRHADEWMDKRLPARAAAPSLLKPLTEVRDASSAAVQREMRRLRQLVEDWQQFHRNGQGETLPAIHDVLQAMDGQGLLDFVTISTKVLINWLDSHGHWPDGMPLTDKRTDLGLTGAQPPAPTVPGASSPPPTPGPRILLNGKSVPAPPDDLAELARAVVADLTLEQLATPAGIATPLTGAVPHPRTPSSGTRSSSGGSYRAPSADSDRNEAIGLAGEAVVAEWLRARYGVEPQDSWKSALRVHGLPGAEPGDDRLGYDFLIHDGDTTLYYEVKASEGDSGDFFFGESEQRHARQLGPHEEYFVVYVSHVLDRERRDVKVLPNPFGAPNLAGYELIGTRMRLRFRLD
ncbi:hypothetical protein ABCR94_17740 [Streptomyces sp. 21So2-11]|uniref:sacsin N-terminal ATP-binding-like domain-containing protein n=1 Tax=Streptomyces sp. 21So2-11 TaxID=3144408 RepID=UPI003219C7C2